MNYQAYIIIAFAFILLLTTSGWVVKTILKRILGKNMLQAASADTTDKVEQQQRLNTGVIIGKCENILILSFVVMGAYTALALVVTAKTFVRKEEIEKNSMFFLAGTLINISYSVFTGLILKLILEAIGFSK